MIKNLIRSLLLTIFVSTLSFAEIVKEIKVEGNQRISKATINVIGEIKLNEDYNNDNLNNILKNLYNSNFFADVNLNLENGILKINVIENPIIEEIVIEGLTNPKFVDSIKERIVLKSRMSFTENQLQNDITLIDNIMKSMGFYFASIQPSILKNDELNSVQLKLIINQGDKAKIKKISFIGDKKIKDKKLLEAIASEEHKFWKFISNKVYLNKNTVELDKRLLKNYYKNRGYYKVNIIDSFAEFSNKGDFNLIFNIDSGDKFFFNDLKLNIPPDYNESDFKGVYKIFDKIKNEKYSLDDLNLVLKEIDKIASIRLYDFIDAEVDESIVDKNKINFTFNIVDSKKFYVERINILGNYQTIEEVIRNRLIVDEGDPLNSLLYNKSLDNIRGLRIFKRVKGEINDGSENNLKVVNITVEEQPTGEISLAAGVGTTGTVIGGGINEKNFMGKGINLNTQLEVSEEAIKGKFVYSKPNFAYTDNTLFTSLEATTTDYLSDYGYKVKKSGFSIAIILVILGKSLISCW